MFDKIYIIFVVALDKIIWTIDVGPSVHKFFLAPQLGYFRVFLGRVRAVRLYRNAIRRVPAYKNYIHKKSIVGPKISFNNISLGDIPEMDKTSYIKKYSLTDKLMDGKLPDSGVMFDESSGSSGKPTSWVRGGKERRFTQRIMQVSFRHYIGHKNPIVINTFSMGAWATGLNTTLSLLGISRIKSTGPDIVKVIDTLNELGSDFEYVITGYPPFLKLIADSTEIDWKKYNITAIYGGEGISESMRQSLLAYYKDVVGSYGASDLEINIAHESKFTIALRQALVKYPQLRQALLTNNHGVIPMIFQYNPYDYIFETNKKGELLVTICRLENISPRIRYNIHDIGQVDNFYSLKKRLNELGRKDLVKLAELDFGVIFHYGRSDLSVDYNGAVVGPEEIKQIISSNPTYAQTIRNFKLISYEDKLANKHLLMAFELAQSQKMSHSQSQILLESTIEQLRIMNLDFKSAYSTASLKPEIKVFSTGAGLFSAKYQKLKNDYIWNIGYEQAKTEGLAQ